MREQIAAALIIATSSAAALLNPDLENAGSRYVGADAVALNSQDIDEDN